MKSRILVLALALLAIVIIGAVLYNTKTINDINGEVVTIKEDSGKSKNVEKDLYKATFFEGNVPQDISPRLVISYGGEDVEVFSGMDAMAGDYGFSKDQKYFYKCQESGHFHGFVEVYALPDFDLVYNIETQMKDGFFIQNCGEYNMGQNSYSFGISKDWNDQPQIIKYNFDVDDKIIKAVKIFCEKNNLSCPQISIIEQGDNYAIAYDGLKLKYFLSSEDNEWQVGIASEESDICDTGVGYSGLVKYCKNRQ